jgi:hypothetical protein
LFGGGSGSGYSNQTHRFNMDSSVWSDTLTCSGSAPSARSLHTSVFYDNYMYICCGSSGGSIDDMHRLKGLI